MFNNKFLYKIQDQLFNVFIFISWSLIIISALGFSQHIPGFLDNLHYYVSIYICIFLMWRFHPFKTRYDFTDLDRKIAFSAGLFILTTSTLNKYLIDIEKKITPIF